MSTSLLEQVEQPRGVATQQWGPAYEAQLASCKGKPAGYLLYARILDGYAGNTLPPA